MTGGCFKKKKQFLEGLFLICEIIFLPVLVSILDLSDAVHESEMEMGKLLKGLILKDRIHARWIFNVKAELCFRSLMLTWRLSSVVHWREFAGARSFLCICARGCSREHVCWLSAGRAGHTAGPRAFFTEVMWDSQWHTERCCKSTVIQQSCSKTQ